MIIIEAGSIPGTVVAVPPDSVIEAFKVCSEMEMICLERQGVGLAAVQVGVPWQLFVVGKGRKFQRFVNCSYEPTHQKMVERIEGCLSLPNRLFRVKRFWKVRVTGHQLVLDNGEPTLVEYDEEHDDVVFQHEIDHQNGILISDIGRELHGYLTIHRS